MIATKPPAVRLRIQTYANRPTPTELPDLAKQGAIIGDLNRAVAEWAVPNGLFNGLKLKKDMQPITDDNRHILLGWLFTPDDGILKPLSTKQLTPQQWHGLDEWIGSEKIGTMWYPRDAFHLEANWILTRAKNLLHILELDNPYLTMQESIVRWEQFEPANETLEVEPGGMIDNAVSYLGATIGKVVEGADAQLNTWYSNIPVYDPQVDFIQTEILENQPVSPSIEEEEITLFEY